MPVVFHIIYCPSVRLFFSFSVGLLLLWAKSIRTCPLLLSLSFLLIVFFFLEFSGALTSGRSRGFRDGGGKGKKRGLLDCSSGRLFISLLPFFFPSFPPSLQEGKRGRKRGRETLIDYPLHAPSQGLACNPGRYPDQKSNQ